VTRCPSRRDEAGRSTQVFIGRDRSYFGGTKVSFEIRTPKFNVKRNNKESGIITSYIKPKWDNIRSHFGSRLTGAASRGCERRKVDRVTWVFGRLGKGPFGTNPIQQLSSASVVRYYLTLPLASFLPDQARDHRGEIPAWGTVRETVPIGGTTVMRAQVLPCIQLQR